MTTSRLLTKVWAYGDANLECPLVQPFDGKSMKTATEDCQWELWYIPNAYSIVSLVEQALKELIISMIELAIAYDLVAAGNVPTMDKISVNLDGWSLYRPKRWAWLLIKWLTLIWHWCHGYWEGVNVTPEKAKKIKDEIDGNTLTKSTPSVALSDVEMYGE